MKNIIITFTILAIFSCSENDHDINLEPGPINPIATSEWKKTSYETYCYVADVLDTIYVDTIGANILKLKFNQDYSVTYFDPVYTEPLIYGTWSISDDQQRLRTTLKRHISGSTGFGTLYYFSNEKITDLTNSSLQLESDTLFSTNGSDDIIIKSVRKFNFHH